MSSFGQPQCNMSSYRQPQCNMKYSRQNGPRISDSVLCKLFQRSVWRQDIEVLSGLVRRAESSSRSRRSIERYAYCVAMACTLNSMEMRRLVSRISNSSSFVSWLLKSRLVQFWLILPYKCYLTLQLYNFCVLSMILYVFYTHLICQIKIKFDFASIFCQFYGSYSTVTIR